MKSSIQNIIPIYAKFQNILPDELSHNNIAEELESVRNEINSIINDDSRNIKNLAVSKVKQLYLMNIGMGRIVAGVHYRSDYVDSLKLGEQLAISILEDQRLTYNENYTFSFTMFNGTPKTIAKP